MSILQALTLGILQGITEFFPISSSGHLVLAESFFGFAPADLLAFNVIIHFATLLAVVWYFKQDLLDLLKGLLSRQKSSLQLFLALVIATIPAVIAGLLYGEFFESIHNPQTVAYLMLATGAYFLISEKLAAKIKHKLSYPSWLYALIVGLSQVFAMLPGISRSGTTLATSMLTGQDRELSAKFSFLIAIPAILGALVYTLLFKSEGLTAVPSASLAAGFLAALIAGYISIRFLMQLYKKHSLSIFAYYLLLLGALILIELNVTMPECLCLLS